jgi:hypothetical protein
MLASLVIRAGRTRKQFHCVVVCPPILVSDGRGETIRGTTGGRVAGVADEARHQRPSCNGGPSVFRRRAEAA